MDNNVPEKVMKAVEAAKTEAAAGATAELSHIKREFEATIAMMGQVSNAPPFAQKITETHIDKILELEQKELEYTYKNENSSKWFFFGVFFVGCCLLFGLVIFLINNNKDAILMDIIKILFGFIGGFGAGFAAKSFRKKE